LPFCVGISQESQFRKREPKHRSHSQGRVVTESAAAETGAQAARSIAIVGLACRYPDADDAASLLDTALTGRRAFRRIPPARLDLADYHNPDPHQRDATYGTRAALLEGWRFDGAAFGISKPEYASADPARWLALETTARALAAAGFPGGTGLPADRAGVYIGHTAVGDGTPATALRLRWPYVRRVFAEALAASEVPAQLGRQVLATAAARYLAPFPPVTTQTLANSSAATIATAICGQFGLRGGGQAVDAAGASSLAAIASACLALSADELDLAVAGGVDLNVGPVDVVTLAKAGVLARDAMLIYDEDPTGFLPGEGCGIVLLMRTADARASNLPVYAEIVGWGQSAGRPALISPVRPADQLAAETDRRLRAMRRAHEMADLDPADIQLVEGCGSAIGTADNAELAALAALRSGARKAAVLGAITANIGHTRAAAGAAGLIKAALAIANGVLPPSTGVRRPHPVLRDARAALRLATAPEPWPPGPRHASVAAAEEDGLVVHLVLRGESSSHDAGKASRGGPGGPQRADQKRLFAAERPLRPVKVAAETALRARTPQAGPGHCFAFLLRAADREAMIELLLTIERRAPWLSDAELQDVAVHFSREAAGVRVSGRNEIRIGLAASGQQDLAALAGEARTMLATLEQGSLVTGSGIYAAAGGRDLAQARIAAVITSQQQAGSELPQRQLTRMLEVMRTLDKLGAQVSAAAGHGMGELAGLVWAGCATEADARTLLQLRTAALAATPSAAPGALGNLITKLGSVAFQHPGRRLISGCTGSELAEPSAIVEALCAELFEVRLAAGGGDSRSLLPAAVTRAADGAALIVQTGHDPRVGAVLVQLAGGSPGSPGRASFPLAVSIDGDPADDATLAPAAAALFAAGAMGKPQALYAERPSRPINIWREPVFISHPCQRLLESEDRAEPAGAGNGQAGHPANRASPEGTGDASASDALARAGASDTAANSGPGDTAARIDASGVGASDVGVATGVAPWFRCYAEQRREPESVLPVRDDQPWRVYTGACGPLGQKVREIFRHDPAAGRTLAVLGRLDDAATREALVLAIKDAISTGQLVAIGGPALAGVWATLHAEHPSIGITSVRAPLTPEGLSAARQVAAAEPGDFRELVIGSDGTIAEPVMCALPQLGGGNFPFGHDDVVLITSTSGAAGLALAHVLACSGAAVAIIGRARRAHDEGVVAGLEELRRAGSRICYELVDLAEHGKVSAAVRRIEARFGCVTAIGHAIGPVDRGALAALDVTAVHRLVRDHTAPLDQVASAVRAVARGGGVRSGQLRVIATFGSVTGRYGLAEEGIGALVTGAITEDGERAAAASPGCQALHVDWPAWSGDALGERADLADAMARSGFAAMPVSDGSRLLLKALGTADRPRLLALHGRVGVPAPRPIAAATAVGQGRAPERFLERVLVHYPGVELITEATLSLSEDPYLADYCIEGVPVLPPSMALEAMAQVASVLAGAPVRHARQVSMNEPVALPAATPAARVGIRILAARDGDGVAVRIRSVNTRFAAYHCSATFGVWGEAEGADGESALPGSEVEGMAFEEPPVEERPFEGLPFDESERGPAPYGPALFKAGRFRLLRSVRLTGRGSAEGVATVAIAAAADGCPWFGVSDAVLQLVQACQPTRPLTFAGCDAITFSDSFCANALPDGDATIRLACESTAAARAGSNGHATPDRRRAPWLVPRPRSQPRGDAVGTALPTWHARVGDSSGRTVMVWAGLRMRDTGQPAAARASSRATATQAAPD
jgi:enediyne polyketide synthase